MFYTIRCPNLNVNKRILSGGDFVGRGTLSEGIMSGRDFVLDFCRAMTMYNYE